MDQVRVQAVYDQPGTGKKFGFDHLEGTLRASKGDVIRGSNQDRIIHASIQNVAQAALDPGRAVDQCIIIKDPKKGEDLPQLLRIKRLGTSELGGGKQVKARIRFRGQESVIQFTIPGGEVDDVIDNVVFKGKKRVKRTKADVCINQDDFPAEPGKGGTEVGGDSGLSDAAFAGRYRNTMIHCDLLWGERITDGQDEFNFAERFLLHIPADKVTRCFRGFRA